MKHNSFKNDYSFAAHPKILEALAKFGAEENIPYGLDKHSENAARLIKETFGAKDAKVFFLAGGTQTNLVFISSVLRHYEGVISPTSGHINVHETAAVEGSGYKVITVNGKDGKLSAEDVNQTVKLFTDEHMVKPRMVYISNSTEIGTIYHKQELTKLYKACKDNGLYLFIDGARLGSALTSLDNDIDPKDLGSLCDAFYVGGTKNGLLFGEALVIVNPELAKDFRFHIKNKGAMLAKGYVVGIQFEEAFKEGLYFELAKRTNQYAVKVREILTKHGYPLLPSPTNQVFARLDKKRAEALINEFGLEKWEEGPDYMVVRFVTSFKTEDNDIESLDHYLSQI